MTPSEIRAKEKKELLKMVDEKRGQLFELKLKWNTGQLAKTADIRKTKKDVARLLTILKENKEVKETKESKETWKNKKTKKQK